MVGGQWVAGGLYYESVVWQAVDERVTFDERVIFAQL